MDVARLEADVVQQIDGCNGQRQRVYAHESDPGSKDQSVEGRDDVQLV
jgi:hypothetical protein